MRMTPPMTVDMRAGQAPLRWELAVRYGAAYLSTLIAIGAAQLKIHNGLALFLTAVTLLGLPLSLWLRRSGLRVGSYRIHRLALNSIIMLLTVAATFAFVVMPMRGDLLGFFSPGFLHYFLVRFSAGASMEMLMTAFLIFAVFRCLAIINDKDAVLSTIPSFSVLLLMIVVHQGPEVVLYFLLWATVSAVMFALDHRSEARLGITGFVPSVVPGQELTLSARTLATVMGFSLLCAIVLSYTLSRRNPEERGFAEDWVANLARRLTQYALNLPDVSVNAGPERQIDFSTGPTLPTRAPIWQINAVTVEGHRPVTPDYWRMFTLADYDGMIWSQRPGQGKAVPLRVLHLPKSVGLENTLRSDLRTRYRAYDIGQHGPRGARALESFGAPRVVVRQTVIARVNNTGFLPALPALRILRLASHDQRSVRVRGDGSVDIAVVDAWRSSTIFSEVPADASFGMPHGGPPLRRNQRPNPHVELSPRERAIYLDLPRTLPPGHRVRRLATQILRGAGPNESDYRRAQRLAMAVQTGEGLNLPPPVYTLRPPATPPQYDAADYFLFESRRGYCTYFAGALTVLCRAAGIPARVVSGFTGGESQRGSNTMVIRESNAHAWTEVWVPNWGWATVDATPAEERGENTVGWWDNWTDAFSALFTTSLKWARQNFGLLVLGCVLALVIGAAAPVFGFRREGGGLAHRGLTVLASKRVEMHDDAARKVIYDAYGRAARTLRRRFRQRTPWETPDEWLHAAETALELRDPQPLRHLTALYVQAKYSPYPLGQEEGLAAHRALGNLSWQRQVSQDQGNLKAPGGGR